LKGVEVEETRETTRTTTATTKATTTACFFFFRGEEKTKVKGAFFYLSFVLVSKRRLLRLFVQRGKRTWTRILRSWDGRERSAGSNEVAARSSHQKNACSSRRLSMASASTPFALTPPGLCFPSPCSPGRQTTCTRHERARDKNKRRSPRGYAETVKSWRVWSFLFPHGDETPTRSLPLPFFRLLSSSPASPPSPHLPSFLQPTKQVSFPLLFLGVEPCAAGRGGNVLERRGKRRSIEEALEGPARRFHGGGPSKSARLVEIFPCCLRCFSLSRFGFCRCRAAYDIEMHASVRFSGRRKARRNEAGALALSRFPCRRKPPAEEKLSSIKHSDTSSHHDSHGRRPRHRAQVSLRGPLERHREALLAGE